MAPLGAFLSVSGNTLPTSLLILGLFHSSFLSQHQVTPQLINCFLFLISYIMSSKTSGHSQSSFEVAEIVISTCVSNQKIMNF